MHYEFKRYRLFEHLVHENVYAFPGGRCVTCEEGGIFEESASGHDARNTSVGGMMEGVGEGEDITVREGRNGGVRGQQFYSFEIYRVRRGSRAHASVDGDEVYAGVLHGVDEIYRLSDLGISYDFLFSYLSIAK